MKRNLFFISLITIFITFQSLAQNNKPQEPKEPFEYSSEDISFINVKADSIKLAGTITIPKNVSNPPVAILISGSGPQNRNEELMDHKSFFVLSNYLTNNGIAVLRYDDRGIAESEGDFKTATSFDFATDVEAAISFLKTRTDIDATKIGLIGHSEGGLIAPIVASQNNDVAFIVLLAGTGVEGWKVMQSQSWKMAEQMGATQPTLEFNNMLTTKVYDVIKAEKNIDSIKAKITNSLNNYKKELNDANSIYEMYINDVLITQLSSIAENKWMRTFIITNPDEYLSKVTCPVLAINGSKDVQVLPKLNLDAIKISLEKANNKDITIKELEGLNHLFQTAETGNVQEYQTIEETFSPTALVIIKDWILKRF
jgi:pimeloyl-ACP methyl ester carboxylesterase